MEKIFTGNDTLDNIFADKSSYCSENGIHFTYVADGGQLSFMSADEITTLIDNALGIVIRYAEKSESIEKRLVKAVIFLKHRFLILRFENYMDVLPAFINGLPVEADKTEDESRFKKMKAVIDKYDGGFSVNAENNWLTICMLIPLT